MQDSLILNHICLAANYRLLHYANTRRDLAGSPSLRRFVGDHGTLKRQSYQHEAALDLALSDFKASRYDRLLALLGDDPCGELARRTLELCVLEHCSPSVGVLLAALQDTPDCTGVSVELALQVYELADEAYVSACVSSFALCVEAYERLKPFLTSLSAPETRYRRRLIADERLIGWLCGQDEPDSALASSFVLYDGAVQPPPPLYARAEQPEAFARVLKPSDASVGFLHIQAEPGSGSRLMLRHAAAIMGRPLAQVSCQPMADAEDEDLREFVRLAQREAVLSGAVLCWYGCDPDKLPQEFLPELFLRPMEKWQLPVCAVTKPGAMFPWLSPLPFSRFEQKPYTRSERIQLWQGFTASQGVQMDCMKYGVKYQLLPSEIQQVVMRLAQEEARGEVLADTLVNQICLEVLPQHSSGSFRRADSLFSFDDLKLPPEQKGTLLKICSHIWQSHRVFDEWGLQDRFPYGRGVTALFTGPPGTGKTMAAHVISNMLGIPLYCVELSQVVDKYIGETEKHLEDIFSLAEKSNAILFFDEADALFGRRSEVTDAKDKYANTEVSYILQRIEKCEGVILLATNYKRNIDEAFMRRMRYVMDFKLPSPAIRKEIWESCFTPETPLSGVDFDFLAEKFEFSGGSIKNIALSAAFLAASDNSPITMRHILSGIRSENQKFGKTMLKMDFGIYGDYVE